MHVRFHPLKFYRAYPELDGYSDEECQRMVWQAIARREDAIWIIPLAGAVVAFLIAGSMAGTLLSVLGSIAVSGGFSAMASSLGSVVVISLIPAVIAWVFTRRTLIIRSIRNNMNRAKCPYCWFSLVGLTAREGEVRCPECGETSSLIELRLTPDDLIDPRHPPPAPPPISALRKDAKGGPITVISGPDRGEVL